ncbi:MAG TPA: TonB-dependent receptor [Steroidobacter sp.]|uniref:TonB-dependent receptor n=1 Tax=Steroidobacter sp. TaxID=1978227 RepID=UPI002EDAFAA9
MRNIHFGFIGLLSAGSVQFVYAADTPQQPVGLEEVVVTASKRAEKVQDVAASVTALSGDALARLNTQDFADYAGLVPGLSFQGGGVIGHNQIVLRGLSTGSLQQASTVGVYIDDVPFGATGGLANAAALSPDPDLFDVERIEVLKGPQGTLYGASTLGGLIKIVPRAADTAGFESSVRVSGNDVADGSNGYGARGMVNMPFADGKAAVRVSGFYRDDAGFVDNLGTQRDDVNSAISRGGRVAVAHKPTDTLSIDLSALIQTADSSGRGFEHVDARTLAPIEGDRTQRTFFSEPTEMKYELYSLKLTYDLGWADVVSVSGYGVIDDVGSFDYTRNYGPLFPIADLGVAIDFARRSDKYTQEIRLASTPDEGRLDWRLGVYYTYEKSLYGAHLNARSLTTGQPMAGVDLYTFDLHSRYREAAGFGDVTIRLTDTLDFISGLRWGRNQQEYTAPNSGLLSGNPLYGGESSDSSWTFNETLRWKPVDGLMSYVTVASGYRPGGPAVIPPGVAAAEAFEPDTVTNYEIGVKSESMDRRLLLNASVFRIDWDDIQLNTLAGGFTIFANGGEARSEGLELEARFAPNDAWSFGAAAGYTSTELLDDAPDSGGVQGDSLPFSPDWSGAFMAEYSFPVGPSARGYLGMTARYVGQSISSFSNSRTNIPARLPSYTPVDLRAGLSFDRWDVNLNVDNLQDKRGISGVLNRQVIPNQGLPSEATLYAPRTISLAVNMHF